jgi:hypothetical protein
VDGPLASAKRRQNGADSVGEADTHMTEGRQPFTAEIKRASY